MKLRSFIVAAFFALVTSSAFAQWFPGLVRTSVLPGQVAFQVVNPNYQPIVCNGQVFGQTIYGHVFTTGFYNQLILGGGFRYAYVNAVPYAPFARGWANIQCRY